MLAESTVAAIEDLLQASTLSQREIARRIGVNRETVSRIATGRRPNYAEIREQQEREAPQNLVDSVRCKGCGARINVVPCQACLAQRQQRRARTLRRCRELARTLAPFGVELKGEQRQRYEAIRREKIARCERPASNWTLLHQALF